MGSLVANVHKLQGRSLDELRVRGVQAARAHLDRLARSHRAADAAPLHQLIDRQALGGRGLGESALLAHFRERGPGCFFASVADHHASTAALRRRWPGLARLTAQAADRIVGGVLNIFGHEIEIGACPDWTLEPISGVRTPPVHFSRIPYLDPGICGDCKITWEINRHQYFLTLGRAYWLTGDERYARTFTRHIASWMDENPPERGINWASSLEVALRSIAWLWSLHFFRHSAHLDERLFTRVVTCLFAHGRHVERYLSTYFSPNTHLTGEALGLLYLGTALPELQRAAAWREAGARILHEQLDRQLFADGVYFEQSTYYHRYTADFYIHALLLAEAKVPSFGAAVRRRLPALLEHLLTITRPDGRSPLIGDDDGGRLLPLGSHITNDFRDTLAVGGALLQRSDFAYVAGSPPEDVLWLLGPAGVAAFDALLPEAPAHTSRAFMASGYYVMRDGWQPGSDYAVIRCGPPAALTGAHAHADALAIELAIGGQALLVDPGTYSYAQASERDSLRVTAAHNTVSVNDESSSDPGDTAFTWRSAATGRRRAWVTHPAFDYFEGDHDGYIRLDTPAMHSRSVFFVKGQYWVIDDRVECAEPVRWTVHLHFAPDLAVATDGGRSIRVRYADGADQRLQLFTREGAVLSREADWVSPGYGRRVAAAACALRTGGNGARRVITVAAGASAVRWDDCEWSELADGSGALTLPLPEARDTILVGECEPEASVSRDGVSAAGRWIWVRRSLSGEPTAFAAIGARRLTIDGEQLLASSTVVGVTVGTRSADGWTIETQQAHVASVSDARGEVAESVCVASAG